MQSTVTAVDSCDGRISLLDHCLSWSKFVNTQLSHSSQWFNVHLGSSCVIDRLLLQVHRFGTVFVRNYVFWTAVLERTFVLLSCGTLWLVFSCAVWQKCHVCRIQIEIYAFAGFFFAFNINCHNLHPSGVAKSTTSFGWGKGGKVIAAGWQVTMCDPIWHVISRSGVVISITNCYIRVYFTLLYFSRVRTIVQQPIVR